MSGTFTKSMARNIFFGGTVFFALLFLALTFDSMQTLPKRDNRANLTPAAVAAKKVWKSITASVATLLGEGAYFAPELGNVLATARARVHQGLDPGAADGAPAVARCPIST